MRNKLMLGAVVSMTLFFANAHADQAAIEIVKGWWLAGIVDEKCTGNVDPDDAKAYVRAFRRMGMADVDIERGFAEGMVSGEGQYPGHTKPPKNECIKASNLMKAKNRLLMLH